MKHSSEIRQVVEASSKVNNLFTVLGGKWPKEKRFGQLIEEVGELSAEILDGNEQSQLDELGDVCFTYIGYIDGLDSSEIKHSGEIKSYISEKTKNIDFSSKDIILLLLSEISVENKLLRKREGRKDYEEGSLEEIKRKYLILFLLSKLTASYNTTILECIDSSISKFERRDIIK